MAAHVRHPDSDAFSTELPQSQRLEAGLLARLVVHDRLELPEDRQALLRQYDLALRVARNYLARRGLGRELAGDLMQSTQDCVQDLCVRLRRAEMRARSEVPLRDLPLPQLLQRISALTPADHRALERPGTGEADGDLGAEDSEPLPGKFPGAQLLASMKEFSLRLLQTTPAAFSQAVAPWEKSQIAAAILNAGHRLDAYTIAALKNVCRSHVLALERVRLEPLDGAHEHPEHRLNRKRFAAVMSPHMRAVVTTACIDALAEIKKGLVPGSKLDRVMPFLAAAIKVLPMLLDSPDEKPFSLARRLLQDQGLFTDQEIRRGLTAAYRHPLYQQVCKRIQRGEQWQH